MNNFKEKYSILLSKIWNYTNNIYLPNNKYTTKNIKTNSWFDIEHMDYIDSKSNYDAKLKKKSIKNPIKCEKIRMYPTKKQRNILKSWMNSYISMYNETISFFKRYYIKNKTVLCDWKKARTYHLKKKKKKKNKIIEKSGIRQYKSKINAHILDLAIKQACASYKSCLSNLKNGNIKKFRLRHLKYSK